jgi:hypothetical protein
VRQLNLQAHWAFHNFRELNSPEFIRFGRVDPLSVLQQVQADVLQRSILSVREPPCHPPPFP